MRPLRRHDPVPIGQGIGRLAARFGVATPELETAVAGLWETCAGRLASQSTYRGVRDGRVHVDVEESIVREEFRWRSEEIVAGLATGLAELGLRGEPPRSIVVRTVRERHSPVVD